MWLAGLFSVYRECAAGYRDPIDHHYLLGILSRLDRQHSIYSYYQFLHGDGRLDDRSGRYVLLAYFANEFAKKSS